MNAPGRKPSGPALVGHLNGSEPAKERLEVILETIAGTLNIPQACERLGIGEAMFHRLRKDVLEAALARLEPKPRGRPPREISPEQARCQELEQRVQSLESDLNLAELREKIAQVMPHLLRDTEASEKKRTAARARCPRGHAASGAAERLATV